MIGIGTELGSERGIGKKPEYSFEAEAFELFLVDADFALRADVDAEAEVVEPADLDGPAVEVDARLILGIVGSWLEGK